MAVIIGDLPRLPKPLAALSAYLGLRDIGAPRNSPEPSGLTTTNPISGLDYDELSWTYSDPGPREPQLRADGFVIYLEFANTAAPNACRILVPSDARSHICLCPSSTYRSYGIAAFRWTHRGIQVGKMKQIAAWKGVL